MYNMQTLWKAVVGWNCTYSSDISQLLEPGNYCADSFL